MPNNAEKLKGILTILQDSISKEDFLKNFQIIINLIKELKRTNALELSFLDNKYTAKVNEIKDNSDKTLTELKKIVGDYLKQEFKNLSEEQRVKLVQVDNRIAELNAIKFPNPADIAEISSKITENKLIPLIPKEDSILAKLFKSGANIASALELLPEGEKLKIEAIEGLTEILEELKKRPQTLGGGGGFSKLAMDFHIIDEETPTGDVDGVNTDYVLNHIPSPTASLKVYLDGQRMKLTTDYTFSGQTITFLSAPLTGSIVTCEYRI